MSLIKIVPRTKGCVHYPSKKTYTVINYIINNDNKKLTSKKNN